MKLLSCHARTDGTCEDDAQICVSLRCMPTIAIHHPRAVRGLPKPWASGGRRSPVSPVSPPQSTSPTLHVTHRKIAGGPQEGPHHHAGAVLCITALCTVTSASVRFHYCDANNNCLSAFATTTTTLFPATEGRRAYIVNSSQMPRKFAYSS